MASQLDIYLFANELQDFSLIPIDKTYRGLITRDIDQIFVAKNDLKKMAVLKLDLRYLGPQGLIRLSKSDYACHGSLLNDRAFSLFTSNIPFEDVDKICNRFKAVSSEKKSAVYFKSFLLQSILFREAQAYCEIPSSTANVQSIKDLSANISASDVFQKIGTCVSDVIRGSGNVFQGIIDGVKDLASFSPFELWEKIKKSASDIKNFVVNIKDEMVKLGAAFSQLNLDLILSIGCNLAGEMITSAGISALTGAGVAMLSARILKIIGKIGKLKHFFDRLNKLTLAGKGKFAERILSCGIR